MTSEPPTTVRSDADFERLSWHDNALYGIRLDPCDPAAGDWRSDLVLAIDHIIEWVRQPGGAVRFRVAPATLTFHDVAGLSLGADWGAETLSDMSIHTIERQALAHPSGRPGLPWYRWRIVLNAPAAASLAFDASGFTQALLAEPVLLSEQALPPAMRRTLLSAAGG